MSGDSFDFLCSLGRSLRLLLCGSGLTGQRIHLARQLLDLPLLQPDDRHQLFVALGAHFVRANSGGGQQHDRHSDAPRASTASHGTPSDCASAKLAKKEHHYKRLHRGRHGRFACTPRWLDHLVEPGASCSGPDFSARLVRMRRSRGRRWPCREFHLRRGCPFGAGSAGKIGQAAALKGAPHVGPRRARGLERASKITAQESF
jgi:hypothetical protein